MNLPQTTISGLIHGKRRITTSLAYQLAYVLGTSPEYWLELQMHYDIENYDKFDESGLTVSLIIRSATLSNQNDDSRRIR